MRVWKNNKGLIACFVFVVGLIWLNSSMLWAKEDEPEINDGNRPGFFEKPGPGMRNEGMPFAPPHDMPPPSMNSDSPFPPPNFKGGFPNQGGSPEEPIRRVNGKRPPPFADPPNDKKMPPMPPPQQNKGQKPLQQEDDITHVVPQKCVPAKGHFVWNFEDEELMNILRQVSDLKCVNIVVHDSINKNLKMTIIGRSPLTPNDAWDVLMAALAAKGLTMIKQVESWTVVKRSDSKNYATPMYENGSRVRDNEGIGTFFYKVKHTSQDVLKNVARALISKDGLVESVGDHFIIVIDSNSNIKRLDSIFTQVDIEDALNKVNVVTLHNADAKTVEKQLRDLFDISSNGQRSRKRRGGAEDKSALELDKIIADERTNSLIVIADKDSVDKLKEVVALIDQPASDQGTKGKSHVKKLKHGDAKEIAETLTKAVSQGRGGGNRFGRRRDEGTNELFEGEVKIIAYAPLNALVIVASANDYRSLLGMIDQLDERKKQVYIESVILDIQANDKGDFGVNIFGGVDPNLLGGSLGLIANPGGKSIVEGIKSAVTSSAVGANITGLGSYGIGGLAVLGNFLSGGVAGIVGQNVPNTQIPSFGAVLQALSENSKVDVLSTPYLLTVDNQEAEMSVGEKVPVLRGTSTLGGGLGGLGGVSQDVRHEDVKLTFKITPHVGAEDNVRLEINQEVNELGGTEKILNQDQYRIRTKSAKTTLVLKDQQTGVIGGLMHHMSSDTDNKVPFLGDIPILGWLFKNKKYRKEKRSLVLIITVYVINSEDDFRKIVDRKLKEREEFARLYYGGKIQNYNPYIDYDKKAGPLSGMLLSVDNEMKKVENGGPGDGSEVIIRPKETPNEKEKGLESPPNINNGNGAHGTNESVHMGDGLREEEFNADNFPFEEFEPHIEEGIVPDANVHELNSGG